MSDEDYGSQYVNNVVEECKLRGLHLSACNEDGSCVYCGFDNSYQENSFEEDWD